MLSLPEIKALAETLLIEYLKGNQVQGVALALGPPPLADFVDLDADRAIGPRPGIDLVVASPVRGRSPHPSRVCISCAAAGRVAAAQLGEKRLFVNSRASMASVPVPRYGLVSDPRPNLALAV